MIQFKRDREGIQQILNSPEMAAGIRQVAEGVASTVRQDLAGEDAEVVVDEYTATARGRFTERAAASVGILHPAGKLWEVRDGVLTHAAGVEGLEVRS